MSIGINSLVPRFNYAEWTIGTPSGGEAERALRAAQRYFWWVAHALFHKEPIPVPCLLPNPVPNITAFVVPEDRGILRVEILGPEYFPGRPRTGVPIATIYVFHDRDGTSKVFQRMWDQLLNDYGSKKRTALPARSFITVIKHKYEKLDVPLTRAIDEISGFLGYAGWMHLIGVTPLNGTQAPYVATLRASDAAARKHIEALAARQPPLVKTVAPVSVVAPTAAVRPAIGDSLIEGAMQRYIARRPAAPSAEELLAVRNYMESMLMRGAAIA